MSPSVYIERRKNDRETATAFAVGMTRTLRRGAGA